jgi:hypothetical protein
MTSSETIRTTSQPTGTVVWDPLVRFGHWALVAAFAVAYFSAEEEAGGPDPLHVWGGYAVGGIVVLRVLGLCWPPSCALQRFHLRAGEGPPVFSRLAAWPVRRLPGAQSRRRRDGDRTGLIAYGEQGKGPL